MSNVPRAPTAKRLGRSRTHISRTPTPHPHRPCASKPSPPTHPTPTRAPSGRATNRRTRHRTRERGRPPPARGYSRPGRVRDHRQINSRAWLLQGDRGPPGNCSPGGPFTVPGPVRCRSRSTRPRPAYAPAAAPTQAPITPPPVPAPARSDPHTGPRRCPDTYRPPGDRRRAPPPCRETARGAARSARPHRSSRGCGVTGSSVPGRPAV